MNSERITQTIEVPWLTSILTIIEFILHMALLNKILLFVRRETASGREG